MNIQTAKATHVFIVDGTTIVETNLYALAMRHVEETTTPMGVGPRYHKRYADDGTVEVWTWGHQGSFPKRVEGDLSEAEADELLFEFATYDLNRADAAWFFSREEAEELIAGYAQ